MILYIFPVLIYSYFLLMLEAVRKKNLQDFTFLLLLSSLKVLPLLFSVCTVPNVCLSFPFSVFFPTLSGCVGSARTSKVHHWSDLIGLCSEH